MKVALFIIALSASMLTACGEQLKTYNVTVVYMNGDQENIKMLSSNRPKIEDSGCLYNYELRSYICGVRKIIVTE